MAWIPPTPHPIVLLGGKCADISDTNNLEAHSLNQFNSQIWSCNLLNSPLCLIYPGTNVTLWKSTRTHTHTSDIYNQTIAAAQLLSNTGCASRSIHRNWLSNGIPIVSTLGRVSSTCLLVMGRLKKMKWLFIYTFSTCWSGLCYVIWNMHVFFWWVTPKYRRTTTLAKQCDRSQMW